MFVLILWPVTIVIVYGNRFPKPEKINTKINLAPLIFAFFNYGTRVLFTDVSKIRLKIIDAIIPPR